MSSFFIEATYLVEAEPPRRAIGRFHFEFNKAPTDPIQFERDLIEEATALIIEAHGSDARFRLHHGHQTDGRLKSLDFVFPVQNNALS